MERDTRLQSIFTYLLIYLLISKALRKERPSMFPESGAPMETEAHSIALLYISFGFPVKEPSLKVRLMESPRREMPSSYSPPSFIIQSPRKDMIYLLTAVGLTPGGSSTVQYSIVQYSTVQYSTVQYTFTHKQYTEQHNDTEQPEWSIHTKNT
jgi:hypothetical protein